jgi:ATP-dependent helicase/nuclease subunit A
VESAWLRLAGPECLWEVGDVRDVQAYFDLIEELDRAGTFDPDQLEVALSELYAAPDAEADGSLQFMTLHKSKGLEFDTVILPGLHRQPKNGDTQLLLWEEVQIDGGAPQLIAAPWVPRHLRDDVPSPYDYLRGLECERSANESARVLYVGATRAIRRLHLVGAVCLDAKNEVKPPVGSFLELLWSTVGGEFLRAAEAPLAPVEQPGSEDFVPKLIRLPAPAIPEMLVARAGMASAANPHEIVRHRDQGSLEASCGTLSHLYMELIAREGETQWQMERLQRLQPAMQSWLQRQGHSAQEAAQGAASVARNLVRTLDSEAGRWVLRSREGGQSEFALATADEHKIATHVMDRTFIEDGQRWIVDYKSAWLGEAADTAALSAFAEQYRAQLERYAGLFVEEGVPVRKAVFFLAHGQLVEL